MYSCTAYNFYTYKVIGTLFVHRELQLHMKNSKNSRHCVRVYRTVWLYSKRFCLRWATIITHSHICSCLWIDKQPAREYTVQIILNFPKAFFCSSLTHISWLRCLHLLALRASLTPLALTQSTCGKSIQICKQ